MSDTESRIITFMVSFLFGAFGVGRGIWMLKGGAKGWYITGNIYGGFSYAQIPAGIGMLWFALAAIPESTDTQLLLIYIGGGFGLFAVIVNFVQPSFLKPAWLKWLERKHGRIKPILVNEAHKMGLEAWQARVETQEDLEAWVVEVRRKHGLEM